VKDGEPVDWRYHLGEDIYVIIKAPQLTIHIRKYFVPNGEWTLHPTKRGVGRNRIGFPKSQIHSLTGIPFCEFCVSSTS
jgi:hypothetical protein